METKLIIFERLRGRGVALGVGVLAVVVLVVAAGWYGVRVYRANMAHLTALEASVGDLVSKVDSLQSENDAAQGQIKQLTDGYMKLSNTPREVVQREVVQARSQSDQLSDAVSRIAPTVVSIVVTKAMPHLDVVYVNPFGDDPRFKDFNIRVPTYREHGTTQQKIGAGTGFLITSDGFVLTNYHVVADTGATYTALLSDGRQLPATVRYRDAAYDVAVIKIDGTTFPAAPLGNSSTLKLGQSVFAVGNALGEYNNTVSVGIISGLNRTVSAYDDFGRPETLSGIIQTDAAINPGNSGGPLVSIDGTVVGMNVAKVVGSDNIAFAIPINNIRDIVSSAVGTSL
jgi:S1-C subfamily serine protease